MFGSQQVITTAAARPHSVYAADLDGDGDLDVLSASYDDDKIAWYENLSQPTQSGIGDKVWYDEDADGVQDPSESGLPGVTVKLLSKTGTVVHTKITDATGTYAFQCAPGDYRLEFVAKDGYVFSPANRGGDDIKDSDADPTTGRTALIHVTADQSIHRWDAGFRRPGVIGTNYDPKVDGFQFLNTADVP